MRAILFVMGFLSVAACGARAPSGIEYATGPISDACLGAGRDKATRPLCQCVQGVANRMLSVRDQNRAVVFFDDPHQAQVTRQSDNPLTEAFWRRYRAFADSAEDICAPVA